MVVCDKYKKQVSLRQKLDDFNIILILRFQLILSDKIRLRLIPTTKMIINLSEYSLINLNILLNFFSYRKLPIVDARTSTINNSYNQ
jgi:hypothetical protein